MHKKYTYKDGKRYGPYAYETRRVGGKVVTSYLGSFHSSSRQWVVYGFLVVLLVALIFISLAYYSPSSTGRVSLDVRTVYNEGEPLSGDLTFRIKEGELVPRDSELVITYGDQSKRLLLSDVLIEPTTTGSFYAEGVNLVGEGEGYGVIGAQTQEVTLDFTLSVSDSSSDVAPDDSGDSSPAPVDVSVPEASSAQIASEEPDDSGDSGSGSGGSSSGNSEASSSSASSAPASSDESSPAPAPRKSSDESSETISITGAVVSENSFDVQGQVSTNGEFRYALESGQSARLVSGSVRANGQEVPDSSISIDEQNGEVIVTSSYFTSEEGFGSAFLGDYALALQVDMEQLELYAVPGELNIQLVYQDNVIASRSETVGVHTPEVAPEIVPDVIPGALLNDTNDTLSSIVQLKSIPLLRVAPGESIVLDMTEYFEGADSFSASIEDFEVSVEGSMVTLTPVLGFKGSRKASIVARDEFGELTSNSFTLLVSSGVVRITTSRDKIVVGEPVRWEKKIVVEDAESLQVELPESVEDVVVKKREGDTYVEIQDVAETTVDPSLGALSTSPLTGHVTIEVRLERQFFLKRWWNQLVGTITGNAVDESLPAQSVDVVLPPEPAEYIVEYYTPAPEAYEEETSSGKRVTISAPDELAYSDIIASATLANENRISSTESILLYWLAPVEEQDTSLKDVAEVAEVEIVEDVLHETAEAIVETPLVPDVVESAPVSDVVSESITGQAVGDVVEEVIPPASEGVAPVAEEVVPVVEGVAEVAVESVPVVSSGVVTRVAVPFDAYDLDEDGFYDYIEWVVPHLSNQTYDIVLITEAQHLDENRTVVSDISSSVKYLDGNWSETIPATHYVRVRYEQNLTNGRDITVYPRTIEGTPRIDIYERNGTSVIASFGSLTDNTYNRLILSGLEGSQDSFDLQVLDGSVQFDQILDPADTTPPTISYVAPTPSNNTFQTGTSFFANLSTADENGEHYAFTDFDRSLVLWLRMDDSNGDTVTDLSTWGNHAPKGSGVTLVANGLYNQSAVFRGIRQDNITVPSSSTLDLKRGMTFAFWINYTAGTNQFARVIGRREVSTTPQTYYQINLNDLGGTTRLTLTANLSGVGVVRITNTNMRISQDRWNHVVFVYNDSGDVEAYINGTAVSVSPTVAGIEGLPALVIGARGTTGTANLNGSMDEILIFNRSLSAQEAIALYNASLNKYYRNFTALTNGTHTLTAHAVDLGANRNSDQRTFTVDTVTPVVILQAPANGSDLTSAVVSFNATFSDSFSLANGTLYLWNSTGSVINTTTRGLSGTTGSINLSVTLPGADTYAWNYLAVDNASNLAFNATNYTFTYTSQLSPLGVSIVSPGNRTYAFNEIPLIFNVTLDSNGGTVLYTLTNGVTNYSMSSTNSRNYNATNTSISSGSYTFKVYANDTAGTRNDTMNVTFSVDTLLLSGCGSLTSAGSTYTLNQSFSAIGSCLQVQANDITLNGAGFTLTGDNAANHIGINASGQQLFTVENLTISNFNTSLSIDSRHSSSVAGNVTLRTVQLASISARGFSNNSASGSGSMGGGVFLVNSNATGFISVRGGNGTTGTAGQPGHVDIRAPFVNLSRVSLDLSQGLNTGGALLVGFVSTLTVNYSSGFEAIYTSYGSSDLKRFSLENRTGGRLVWADPLFEGEIAMELTMPENVSRHIVVRSNFAYLNTTAASAFNIPTVITFYNMPGTYRAPVMLRDHAYCASATCSNSTSLNAQTVTFTAQDWSSNYSIGEDPTFPRPTIVYPTNVTYTSSVTALNYTVSDSASNVQACWYSLDNGATNTSITCGTNATGLTASQGSNTWSVYVNDTAGNFNSTSVTFSVDGTAPTIDFGTQTEANNTYLNRTWMIVNVTATDSSLQSIVLRLNNATALVNSSTSATSPLFANFTNLLDGVHYFNATANDTLGNLNTSVTRTITIDTTAPVVSFVDPTLVSGSYGGSSLAFNITATDTNLGTLIVRLYNTTGLVNSSTSATSPLYANFTNLLDGSYTVNVTVNDSAGNTALLNRTYTIDLTGPSISYQAPTETDGSFLNRSYILVNVTATDSSLQSIVLRLNNATALVNSSTSATSPLYANFTNLLDGVHYFNATANDTVGNSNVTSTYNVTIDRVAPVLNFTTGSDSNNSFVTRRFIIVNASAVDTNLVNITVSIVNSSGSTVNTSSSNSATTPLYANLSVHDDGTYYATFTALDRAGNLNTSTARTITIDTLRPTLSFVAPSEINGTYFARPRIYVNVTGSDANLQTISIRLYSGGSLLLSENSTTSPLFANFDNLDDGTYQYNASVNDTAGNVNHSETRTVTVDITVPLVSLVSPTLAAGTYRSTSIAVNVTGADNNLETLLISLSNSTQANINTTSNRTSPLYINFTGLPSGTYYVNVTVNDTAGTNVTAGRTYVLDTIAPTVSIVYPTNTSYSSLITALNYTVSDAFGTIQACWYSLNNGATNTSITCGTNATGLTASQGSNTWRVYVNDTAGNFNSTSVTFSIDGVAPTIDFGTQTEVNNTYLNRTWVIINVTATDSNLQSIVARLNNATALVNSSSSATSPLYANFTNLLDGVHYFNASANDTLGNLNTTVTRTITIDTLAPTVSFVSPTLAAGTYAGSSLSFNVTATDTNLGTLIVRLYNATALVNSSSSATSPLYANFTNLLDGSYTVNVTVNDTAGNTALLNRTYTIDLTGPSISYQAPTETDGSFLNRSFILVNVTATDTSLQSIVLRLNNATALVNSSSSATSPLYANFTNLLDGVHYFNATANDTVGNSNVTSTYNVTIDRVASVLNFTTGSDSNNSFVTRRFIIVNASAVDTNLVNITVSIVNSSGSTVNTSSSNSATTPLYANLSVHDDGTYYATFTALDRAGNLNTSVTRTITIDTLRPTLSFVAPSDANGTYFARSSIKVNVTGSDANMQALTIRLYSGGSLVSSVNSTISPFFTSFDSLDDGTYQYNASVNDTSGNVNHSETRTVTVDIAIPLVSLVSPTLASGTYRSTSIAVNVTGADNNLETLLISLSNSTQADINTTSSRTSPLYINFTGLPSGTYYVNVTVNDSAGTNVTAGRTYVLDTIAPTVSIVYPTNTSYSSLITALNYTVSDAFGTIQACWYSLNNGATNTSITCGTNATGLTASQGSNTWRVYVNDTAGNFNSTSVTFSIDGVAPTIDFGTQTEVNNTYLNRTWVIINATATDSNLQSIVARLNNATALVNSSTSTTSPLYANFTNLLDGVHYFNATANDTLGNLNTTATRTITIDTTRPLIQFVSPTLTAGTHVASAIALNATATDTNLGTLIVRLYNASGLVNSSTSATSPLYANFTNLPDGTYYVNATVNDTAGNTNVTSTSTYVLDSRAPLVSIVYPTNTTYASLITAFNYTVSDTAGNVQACWYSLNNGATNTTIACGTNATGLTASQGSNTWRVYVNDTAGNFNSTSVTFSVDTLVPGIEFVAPTEANNSYLARSFILINASASDSNLQSIVARLNNATALVNSSSSATSPLYANFTNLVDGVYYFNASVNDSIGNTNRTGTYTVTLDTIAPVVSFTTASDSNATLVARRTVILNASAVDTNLVNITLFVVNASGSVVNTSSSNNASTPFYRNFTVLSDGVYYFNFSATDRAGNTNASETRVITIDSVRPLITYALGTENAAEKVANASLALNLSITEANVANMTFSLYNASSVYNRTVVTVSTSTFNWTNIPAGEYRYEVNVTDSANNRNGTGSRTVTLIRECLGLCTEEAGCILANTSCYLSSATCTGGVCNFANFTLHNSTVYTLYNASGDAYSLALTLSSNASDAFGSLVSSKIVFGGKNGSTLTGGSRGGHAGVLNITLTGLFNRTNTIFIGRGGRSTSGDVGGNGGILQINYHGLLGEASTWTNITAAGLNATNSTTGSAGSTLMVKDLNCPRDADVRDTGLIDSGDVIVIRNTYGNISTDSTFNSYYDVNCDGIINVIDLARVGFEFDRGFS